MVQLLFRLRLFTVSCSAFISLLQYLLSFLSSYALIHWWSYYFSSLQSSPLYFSIHIFMHAQDQWRYVFKINHSFHYLSILPNHTVHTYRLKRFFSYLYIVLVHPCPPGGGICNTATSNCDTSCWSEASNTRKQGNSDWSWVIIDFLCFESKPEQKWGTRQAQENKKIAISSSSSCF